MTLCHYFLCFMLFSFLGWLLETLLYLIRDRQCVKRGFLFGPVCPIYGFGAIFCVLLLSPFQDQALHVFMGGCFICGLLEYGVHHMMEKLFHAVWWDYSDRKWNLHGRIYFMGLIYFGMCAVIVVCLIQPQLQAWLGKMTFGETFLISLVCYTLLIGDTAVTVMDLKGTVTQLKKWQANILTIGQRGIDITHDYLSQFIKQHKTRM